MQSFNTKCCKHCSSVVMTIWAVSSTRLAGTDKWSFPALSSTQQCFNHITQILASSGVLMATKYWKTSAANFPTVPDIWEIISKLRASKCPMCQITLSTREKYVKTNNFLGLLVFYIIYSIFGSNLHTLCPVWSQYHFATHFILCYHALYLLQSRWGRKLSP